MNLGPTAALNSLWLLCLLVPAALMITAPPLGTVLGEEPPAAVIITDTVDYCDHLQRMIGDRAAHAGEAHRLFVEGRRMCDHGDVRSGIARLRQALILVRHYPAPSPH